HQVYHGCARVLAFVEHAVDLVSDRHRDAHVGGLLMDALRREDAFGHLGHACQDPVELLACGEAEADLAVAAVRADARRDEVAGRRRATSSAWLGPLSTAKGRLPSSSAMIWVGRRNVPISTPLVRLITGTPAGSREAIRFNVGRRWTVGIAMISSSAACTASPMSTVKRTSAGIGTPGSSRTFSRRS